MAATAQMQWTLSEHESQATLKAWKDNLMCFLSQEEIFRPFYYLMLHGVAGDLLLMITSCLYACVDEVQVCV